MRSTIAAYGHILKPGITISNTIAAFAGVLLGVSVTHHIEIGVWLALVGGIAAVIGSACVANNIIDRRIDAAMKRTKRREMVTGSIPRPAAVVYSCVLGFVGFGLLVVGTNAVTVLLGMIAYVCYVVIYGIAKRTTVWSTLIGTLPGALPPAAGYTAVTGRFDSTAVVVFMMMVVWQLAHFYAIAMFRRDDYAAAGLPIWSVRYGLASTKRQLFLGVLLFVLLAPALTLLHTTGWIYAVLMSGLGVWWLVTGWRSYGGDPTKWARKMFGVSLAVLLAMCALWAIGGFLP